MASLFNLPPRSTKEGDSLILEKATKKSNKATGVITVKGDSGIFNKMPIINELVRKHLGKYEHELMLIQDEKTFYDYIEASIKNGVISIDTETTSLNPITCTIAGVCLYTPGQKSVYVPINHVDYITKERIKNQLSAQVVTEGLRRIKEAQTKIIMFMAKFDTRVISNQLGISIVAYWCGYVAARLLNENEDSNTLKQLHAKYCGNGESIDAVSFGDLFDDVPFTSVRLDIAYLYAARDPKITYELYKFQEPFLTPTDEMCKRQELEGVAYVFRHIEMPLIPVVAEMEDTGILVDVKLAEQLAVKYDLKLKEELAKNFGVLGTFGAKLDEYRKQKGNSNKLEYPVNINSPTQVAIVLYDILKLDPVDKRKPRGTGEEILEKIDHPIAQSILNYREIAKLMSTYIIKLPKEVNEKTGRIHASFNQMGTETGRFSSEKPNLQNIPRDNKDIRKIFRATDGYVLLSSDYSAQEPRITAHMSKDAKMIKAYRDGLDLYAVIAGLAFNVAYEDCLEFKPDGTKSSEGKARRQTAKAIVLGVCYGKGIPAIATDLGITKERATEIYNTIMKLFPGLKQFMIDSEEMARTKGYVTTNWGRKRRLVDMQLPQYEFEIVQSAKEAYNFDPLADFTETEEAGEEYLSDAEIDKYTKMLNKCYGFNAKKALKDKLLAQGIKVKDNGKAIAEATRQTVNARIQGSGADQTKLAMIQVGNDKQLKEWGFRLLIQVHDELIGECPEENVRLVAPRFANLMLEAANSLSVPSKCDVEIMKCWSGEVLHYD